MDLQPNGLQKLAAGASAGALESLITVSMIVFSQHLQS